jgi:VIT1/CCC1 family predicted Fe2+/Mn2+ transporter
MRVAGKARLQIGRRTLPIVLGLLDGITNTLGLTSGSLLHGGGGVSPGLSLRVATFAWATALVAIFGARYVELRVGLIRASKQLNLLQRGALATTRLGRAARRHALTDALHGSVASFLGAYLPLVIATLLPAITWLSLVIAVGMLSLLGALFARQIGANVVLWASGLTAAGIVLVGIGAELNIA